MKFLLLPFAFSLGFNVLGQEQRDLAENFGTTGSLQQNDNGPLASTETAPVFEQNDDAPISTSSLPIEEPVTSNDPAIAETTVTFEQNDDGPIVTTTLPVEDFVESSSAAFSVFQDDDPATTESLSTESSLVETTAEQNDDAPTSTQLPVDETTSLSDSEATSLTLPSSTRSPPLCQDFINPKTGKSDCPRMRRQCSWRFRRDFMKKNCSRTCGYCRQGSTTRRPRRLWRRIFG